MPQKIRQSFLGNIGSIQAEAGIVTLNSINKLQTRLLEIEGATSNFTTIITSEVAAASVLKVRKNSTAPDVGSRNRLNFIEGGNITLTVADDIADNEIDITVAMTSTGVATRGTFWSSTNLLSSDAAWVWNNTTKRMSFNAGTAPDARVHSIDTTEPLRLGYDASNYMGVNVRANGSAVLDSTGTLPSIETGVEVPLGVNCTPTAWLQVQNSGVDPAAAILALTPWMWHSADYLTSGGSSKVDGDHLALSSGGDTWYDRSLNGRTMQFFTDGSATVNVTYQITGEFSVTPELPAIRFIDQGRGHWAAQSLTDFSIFAVYKMDAASQTNGIFCFRHSSSDPDFVQFPCDPTSALQRENWRIQYDTNNPPSGCFIPRIAAAWTNTAYNVHALTKDNTTGSHTMYVNGTTIGSSSDDGFMSSLVATLAFDRFRTRTGTAPEPINLAELIVFDRVVDSTERATITTYLNNKYGLNGGVPTVDSTRDFAKFDSTDGDQLAFIDGTGLTALTDTDSSADTLAARLLLRQADGHVMRLESNGTFNTDLLLTTPTANRNVTIPNDSGTILLYTPTSLASNDIVQYNGTTWVNRTLAAAGVVAGSGEGQVVARWVGALGAPSSTLEKGQIFDNSDGVYFTSSGGALVSGARFYFFSGTEPTTPGKIVVIAGSGQASNADGSNIELKFGDPHGSGQPGRVVVKTTSGFYASLGTDLLTADHDFLFPDGGASNVFAMAGTSLFDYGITDAAPLSHVGTGGAEHANVVAAGAAGFMTGADKTKLDGIAAGATAAVGANPSAALIGMSAINGSATTFLRSDGRPAIDPAIAPTWSGIHTFSLESVHNGGIDMGTGVSNVGRFDSQVTDASTARAFLFQPTNAITATVAQERSIFRVNDSTAVAAMNIWPDRRVEFGGSGAPTSASGDGVMVVSAATAFATGIFFSAATTSSAGISLAGYSTVTTGAYFADTPSAASTCTNAAGGVFVANASATAAANDRSFYGGIFRASQGAVGATNTGRIWTFYGWKVAKPTLPAISNARGTVGNLYGGYLEAATGGYASAVTNEYQLYVEQAAIGATIKNGIFLANATAGYKAIAIRDQDAWIGSDAAATLTIGGTNCVIQTTNIGLFGVAAIARPTVAIAAAAFVTNTSLIANDTATFDGYTIGQVVKALRNIGILT